MTPTDQHKDTLIGRTTEATLGLTKNTFSAGAHGGALYYMIRQESPEPEYFLL